MVALIVQLHEVLQGRPGRPVDFETFKNFENFDLMVRATEAVDRSDFSNVDLRPNWVYGYRQGVTVDVGKDRGYRPGRLMFMVAGLTGPIF